MVRYLILSLLIISLFGCGEPEKFSVLQANISGNGLLSHFPSGSLDIKVYPGKTTDGESLECSDLLDNYSSVQGKLPGSELSFNYTIPTTGTPSYKSEGNSITPGNDKLVYLQLKNSDGTLKGHACERVVLCSYAHVDPRQESYYDIRDGDKACVYLTIELIK